VGQTTAICTSSTFGAASSLPMWKWPCRICFEMWSNGGKHWVTFQKRLLCFVEPGRGRNLLSPNGTDDEKGFGLIPWGWDWAHSTVRYNNSFLLISTHCEGKLLCCGPLDFVLCFLEQARFKLCTLLVLTATTTSWFWFNFWSGCGGGGLVVANFSTPPHAPLQWN
jgi:hypothetical protein